MYCLNKEINLLMENGDKITIVSLCYKDYTKLYRTIDSVLYQDYPNIEYIISDDGGGGFPKNEVEEYIRINNKGNIKNWGVRENESNLGTVKHENIVCSIADGEYIIQLACGDLFYNSSVLTDIVKKIRKTNQKIYVFSRIVCNENNDQLYFLPHLHDVNKIMKMNRQQQYEAFITGYFWEMASGSAVAYKTDFIKKTKFDEKYRLMEDYPIFTKYLWKNKLCCCYDIVAVCYYLGGVSNTINPLIKTDMNIYDNNDRIEHFQKISFFSKEKIRYQLQRKKTKLNLKIFIRFPHVLLWVFLYKINRKIGENQDKKNLRRK